MATQIQRVLLGAGLVVSSLLVAAAAQAQDVSFVGARMDYEVGIAPYSVVVGDFNGDGVQDLAVVSRVTRSLFFQPGVVVVLLGNGDGTFRQAGRYGVGIHPSSIAVGDFNGDGVQDLVVANSGGSPYGVSVLLGNGDGTFQARHLGSGTAARSVAVGDFNGDGVQDLALANSNNVGVLLGNGDGTFQEAQTFAPGSSPTWVTVGDFNRDGRVDLAVSRSGSDEVSVFLGNGDGTFQEARNFGAGNSPEFIAVGDFNGDGLQDLAVANPGTSPACDDGTASVLLGNGDGSFQEARSFNAGCRPAAVAVGDFNGDGVQDLAVANGASNYVSVLLGNGDGSFDAARSVGVGGGPYSVAVGDFNGDGFQDLAVANNSSDTVSALLGKGDGSFLEPPRFRVGDDPSSVAVGDFNGDGVQDLAVTNARSNDISVLLGNTDGTFQEARSFGSGSVSLGVVVGDFNRDGVPDLAVANAGTYPRYDDASVSVLLGNGDGTFQEARNFEVASSPRSIAVGDFNRDGFLDLVVANHPSDNVSVLLGNGDGTFQAPGNFFAGRGPVSVAVGDFNGDGAQDLAVASANGYFGNVSVLLGNRDGSFQQEQEFVVGSGPVSIAVGDFNGDGVEDLAVARFCTIPRCVTGYASVLLGNGDGSFQPVRDFVVGTGAGSILVGDFNADGVQDLAMGNANYVSVLVGDGNGSFQPPRTFAPGGHSIAAGDFNRDGRLDLAAANTVSFGAVWVLINNTRR